MKYKLQNNRTSHKNCNSCGEYLDFSEYYVTKNGYSNRCKVCSRSANRKSYLKRKNRILENNISRTPMLEKNLIKMNEILLKVKKDIPYSILTFSMKNENSNDLKMIFKETSSGINIITVEEKGVIIKAFESMCLDTIISIAARELSKRYLVVEGYEEYLLKGDS